MKTNFFPVIVLDFFGIGALLGLIALLRMVYRIIKGKSFIMAPPKVPGVNYERAKKLSFYGTICGYIFVIICLAFSVFCVTIPAILDMPYLISGKYEIAEGTIVEVQGSSVTMKELSSNTERTIDISGNVNKGDHIKMEYLPHSNIVLAVETYGESE